MNIFLLSIAKGKLQSKEVAAAGQVSTLCCRNNKGRILTLQQQAQRKCASWLQDPIPWPEVSLCCVGAAAACFKQCR